MLAGGNPQITTGEWDGPARAYIEAGDKAPHGPRHRRATAARRAGPDALYIVFETGLEAGQFPAQVLA
jgi:hypothetical protein